jgi:transposase
MGKWYSSDLRDRISAHVASGGTRRGAARQFGVSPSCAVKLAQRVAQTGSTSPARQGRPVGGGKLAGHMASLMRWVEAEPDITMPELSAKLAAATGVKAHPASLSRALCKAGYSFKKNASGIGVRAR